MIKQLPNAMGEVVFATGKMIKLSIGITLRPGQQVYLPPVAGGKLGKVDEIAMVIEGETPQIVLRIIDTTGKGHQFKFDTV